MEKSIYLAIALAVFLGLGMQVLGTLVIEPKAVLFEPEAAFENLQVTVNEPFFEKLEVGLKETKAFSAIKISDPLQKSVKIRLDSMKRSQKRAGVTVFFGTKNVGSFELLQGEKIRIGPEAVITFVYFTDEKALFSAGLDKSVKVQNVQPYELPPAPYPQTSESINDNSFGENAFERIAGIVGPVLGTTQSASASQTAIMPQTTETTSGSADYFPQLPSLPLDESEDELPPSPSDEFFGGQKSVPLSPVISDSTTSISVYPTKTFSVDSTGTQKESFEVPEQFEQFANSAQKINSFSIDPYAGKVIADIESNGKTLVQEISSDFLPQVQFKDMAIYSLPQEQKLVIAQGEAVIETDKKIESIGDSLFISSDYSKKKLKVLPAEASKNARQNGLDGLSGKLVVENDNALYKFENTQNGKLLGIIAVEYQISMEINASTGQTKTQKPFWDVLVVKS